MPLVFPIGLSYVASALKAHHEVHCWDPNVSDNPLTELPRLLEKVDPQVVGVSLRNIDAALSDVHEWYYPQFVSLLRAIRKEAPHCKIVVGGAGFTLFAEEIMQRNPEIDFGVVSEGEHSFSQLLNDFEHPERTNNLILRKNGKVYFTERKQIENLGALPPPSRELFELGKYKKRRYSMNLITKRGCTFECIFCSNTYITGYQCRLRPPKTVVDEIEQMKNDFGIDSYFFADSTFNHPFDYARRICQELCKRKLETSWIADFHPAYLSKSFMEEAVQSGCNLFGFSPDGATNRTLAFLKKNMRVEHIQKSIKLVKDVEGAKANYNFMYAVPQYNSEHTVSLIRLALKIELSLRDKLHGLNFTKIRIFPHSPLYNFAISEGIITKDQSTLYPIYYPGSSNFSAETIISGILKNSIYLFHKIRKSPLN